VQKYLNEYNISPPQPGMPLGYLHMQQNNGQEVISKLIGFAVSVDYMTSSLKSMNYIGQQIGQITTQEANIKTVSVPLLGTGAGGLKSEEVITHLREGFVLRAHSESTMVISILDKDVFKRIRNNFSLNKRKLKVFLCHSSQDKTKVRKLYQRLKTDEIEAWFDEESLFPGQDWHREIRYAVTKSDVVIVCISEQAVNKRGFLHKEIKYALDVADEHPENAIFIIPLKLEQCDVPERLNRWQWLNYFEETAYEKLLGSLRLCASKLELEQAEENENGEFNIN
jgi:hypothetical protein